MKEIIKNFDGNAPYKALKEAMNNKGKINDYLLEEIEKFIKNSDYEMPNSVSYSILLLAQFEDARLIPLLEKIMENSDSFEHEIINFIDSILVSVVDDYKIVNRIMENEKIDGGFKAIIVNCYSYFYKNKIITKEELEKYLKKIIEMYNYDDEDIYNGILEVIVENHLFSFIEEVQKMYENDCINVMVQGNYMNFIDDIFNYDIKPSLEKITNALETVKEEEMFESKIQECMGSFIEKNLNKKVGRNDLCPCGSGKKYKKCCLNKEINYFKNWMENNLNKYPKRKDSEDKIDIYDFYKEEYIEIDKLIYTVLGTDNISGNVKRDVYKENLIRREYLRKAFLKIKEVIKNNNFKSIYEYDKVAAIHYNLFCFFANYTRILDYNLNNKIDYEDNLKELEDITNYFYDTFDLTDENEGIFLDKKAAVYIFSEKADEGIKYFKERLNNCLASVEGIIKKILINLYYEAGKASEAYK